MSSHLTVLSIASSQDFSFCSCFIIGAFNIGSVKQRSQRLIFAYHDGEKLPYASECSQP